MYLQLTKYLMGSKFKLDKYFNIYVLYFFYFVQLYSIHVRDNAINFNVIYNELIIYNYLV